MADPLEAMGGLNRRSSDRFIAEAVPRSHIARRLIDIGAARPEPVEILSAAMALAWGLVLLGSDHAMEGVATAAMRELAPPLLWGLGALGLAALQLAALLGLPAHRRAAAFLALAMWAWLAWVLWLSSPGIVAPWTHAVLAASMWWAHQRIR